MSKKSSALLLAAPIDEMALSKILAACYLLARSYAPASERAKETISKASNVVKCAPPIVTPVKHSSLVTTDVSSIRTK